MTDRQLLYPELGHWNSRWAGAGLAGDSISLKKEGPAIWRSAVFSEEFGALLIKELEHQCSAPGSGELQKRFNMYGLHILDGFSMRPFFDGIAAELTKKWIHGRFPMISLECSGAFVVRYCAGDSGHMAHEDSSDITINACLGKDGFAGGELFTARCPASAREVLARARAIMSDSDADIDRNEGVFPKYLYDKHRQNIGQALIHAGRVTHGAAHLAKGERLNLIIWLRFVWNRDSDASVSLLSLPDDVLGSVMEKLPPRSVCLFGATCSRLNSLSRSNDLWVCLWHQFPPAVTNPIIGGGSDGAASSGAAAAGIVARPHRFIPVYGPKVVLEFFPLPAPQVSSDMPKGAVRAAWVKAHTEKLPEVFRSLRRATMPVMMKRMASFSPEARADEWLSDRITEAYGASQYNVCMLEPLAAQPPVCTFPSLFPPVSELSEEDVAKFTGQIISEFGQAMLRPARDRLVQQFQHRIGPRFQPFFQ